MMIFKKSLFQNIFQIIFQQIFSAGWVIGQQQPWQATLDPNRNGSFFSHQPTTSIPDEVLAGVFYNVKNGSSFITSKSSSENLSNQKKTLRLQK